MKKILKEHAPGIDDFFENVLPDLFKDLGLIANTAYKTLMMMSIQGLIADPRARKQAMEKYKSDINSIRN